MMIDPKTPRPPAKEMVMLMNGYNLVDDYKSNESTTLHPPTALNCVPILTEQLNKSSYWTR